MDVRLPDGTILRNVPEGTTKAQIMERLGKSRQPQELTAAERYLAPVLEAVGIGKVPEEAVRGLVQGGADPVLGAAQLLAPEGSAVDKGIRKQQADYEASRGSDAGSLDLWRMGGSVVSPLALVGAGAPAAATAAARAGQGAGMGFLGGLTNPVTGDDFWGEKGAQTAIGTAGGAVLPLGWEGAKAGGRWLRNVVQPLMGRSGAERSAGRLANEIAGDKSDEVIDALLKSREGVTAGQAAVPARSAEFSALSSIAEKNKPTPASSLRAAQQQERADVVRDIAKTPAELAAAKAARKASADVNYSKAYANQIKADPELAQLASNPFFKKALPAADELAKARGIDPKTNLTEYLQFVKEGLDVQLSKSGDNALSSTAKSTVAEVKDRLLGWLAKKNPDFDTARTTFAAESKPINKMVAGAELEKALTSGTGKERVTSFTNAVKNAQNIPELRKKTGVNRFGSLEDIIGPDDMGGVKSVVEAMTRDVDFEDLARAGMPKTSRAVGEFEPQKFVNPLERTIMVVNALISRAAGKGSKRTMDALSDLNLTPQQLGEVMQKAKPFERQEIVDMLMRMQAAGIGQAP